MIEQKIKATRQHVLINTYGQLISAVENGLITQAQAVAVSYQRRPDGRMGMCQVNKAVIFSPFFDTNPQAHWSDHNKKTFSGNRSKSVPEAIAWASEKYGIKDWKGNRMGDKVPAIVQKRFPIPARKDAGGGR